MNPHYGVLDNEPSALELKNRALAREAAAEGFVLLKNEGNVLPLQKKNIALYGMGARKTVKGGLGSGGVNERYSVNIEDGLKNAGFVITSNRWLDDYDVEYAASYQSFVDMVESKIAGLTNPMDIIPLVGTYVFRYPGGRPIDLQDVAESDTDTAIYVLMRQAGEGNDRKLEEGDYYITETERANLRMVATQYKHTILVINIGGFLDMQFLDEIPGIDAVVMFVQGGEEGGNALADVLSGKVNFSGKLSDTVPLRYEDIPFGEEFGYLNGNLDNEYYKEGIYVGYRYYDSFDKAVRYPFGFGLSYTSFAWEVTDVQAQILPNGIPVQVCVTVTNTGKMAGKEVLQLYTSAPAGKLHREYQQLSAYAKTPLLSCGESCRVCLQFDLADCAGYDEDTASKLLEQGKYLLRLGNSSRNTAVAGVLTLDTTAVISRHKNCCCKTDDFEELTAPARPVCEEEIEGKTCIALNPAAFITKEFDYSEPQVCECARETAILDTLDVMEQAELLMGGEFRQLPDGVLEIHGAAGKTTTNLISKGIRNVIFSDGPAGVNVVAKICQLADGSFVPSTVPEQYNWGMLKQFGSRMCSTDGTLIYRYATAWPVELLLAQTWNTPLLTRIGEAISEEMTRFGITVWLSPGMNIHRNPLGGRTFEYYSEDPFLTGSMAIALTRGVESAPGCGVSLKHFCCNNTEDNRNNMSANVSERALREIYLKGFEMAVKETNAATVMTS